MTILRGSGISAVLASALFLSSCGPTTKDRLVGLEKGASRDDIVAILGPPVPDSEWRPSEALKVPDGCASQLLYRDEHTRGYAKAVSSRLSCGGTWLQLCFDEQGGYVPGARFTMVTC